MKDKKSRLLGRLRPFEHVPKNACLEPTDAGDDSWLIAIIESRRHEVGVPVNIDQL